ncbi:MAG TPA: hypothetical protein VII63_09790 [Caulobacteraceae bacterium]
MPILQNPKHEAFAQARAKGARLDDAYEDSGFVPAAGHPTRLAQRPEVAERIAELRASVAAAAEANSASVIAGLLRIAKASEDLGSPSGIKEARVTLLEAHRLCENLAGHRADERREELRRNRY